MDYYNFGIQLRKIRKTLNYTQSYVCKTCNISEGTLRRIENGKGNITLNTIENLSQLYKIDLFRLITYTRKKTDLLSDSLVNKLSEIFNDFEKENISLNLDKLINLFKNLTDDNINPELIKLLQMLKDVQLVDVRYKNMNSVELEKILLNLSQSNNTLLSDRYLYDIELFISIYLASIERKLGNFDRALSILRKSKEFLLTQDNLTLRQHNFLGSITLTICYIHHRQGLYSEIIYEINSLLSNNKYQISRYIITDLQLRMGITYLHLGNKKKAMQYINSSLLYENDNRRNIRLEILSSQYDIDNIELL